MTKHTEQLINVLLVGEQNKCQSFIEAVQGFPVKQMVHLYKNFTIENKFKLSCITHIKGLQELFKFEDHQLASVFLQDENTDNCDAVIYLDPIPEDRALFENFIYQNKCITIEFDTKELTALECLHKVELLNYQRIEKSMLVLAGNKDVDSDFSVLPTEIALQISSFQYEVSRQHSAKSFFKPAESILPVDEAVEEAGEKFCCKCSIQ